MKAGGLSTKVLVNITVKLLMNGALVDDEMMVLVPARKVESVVHVGLVEL